MPLADPEFLQALTWSRAAQVLSEATHRRKATLNTLEAAAEQMACLPGQRLLVSVKDPDADRTVQRSAIFGID